MLAGLPLGIFVGIHPWNIPWSSPASSQKTLSVSSLLVRLAQFWDQRISASMREYLNANLLTENISTTTNL